MAAIFDGNPVSALIDLLVPEQHLIDWKAYQIETFGRLEAARIKNSSRSVPQPVEEKIRAYLKRTFTEDLSALEIVQTDICSGIGFFGSTKHLKNCAGIMINPAIVKQLNAQEGLTKENKIAFGSAAVYFLQDRGIKGEVRIEKQSAKWRLLTFAAVSALMSPLVYYAPNSLMRFSAVGSTITFGSMIGAAVDYFYKKNRREIEQLKEECISAYAVGFDEGRLTVLK